MALLKEFKEFAMRGNVIDMAVGVVIGAAFGCRRYHNASCGSGDRRNQFHRLQVCDPAGCH